MKGGDSGLVEARTYCDLCRESNEPCPPSNNFPAFLDLIQEMIGENLRVKTEPVESEPTRFPIEVEDNNERSKKAQSQEQERQQEPHICSQPTPDPIWRGSMVIEKKHWKLKGLVAHSSTRACSKVHDVTNSLPKSLRLELLPRLAVWPKRFRSRALQDADIGVYFFSETNSEKDFDKLLDFMIGRDMAVKTSLDFADLLIFTSHQLPLQHRTLQGKHYLWGLFSREKFSSKSIQIGSKC